VGFRRPWIDGQECPSYFSLSTALEVGGFVFNEGERLTGEVE
jgi:hypothetical protein